MENYTQELLEDAQRNAERDMIVKKMSKLEKGILIAAWIGTMITLPFVLKDCQQKLNMHPKYANKTSKSIAANYDIKKSTMNINALDDDPFCKYLMPPN